MYVYYPGLGWYHEPSRIWSITSDNFLEQGTEDYNTKRTQVLAMICEQYSPEAWTHVYIDGSAANATTN